MKLFLIYFFVAVPAFAQLAWETKQLDFKSVASDENITAKFRFQNAGQQPVKILYISTSCGCTTAGTAKKIYSPGEKGEVEVTFTFGGRRGLQNKVIVVQSDDPKEPSVALMLKVDILEVVKVRPTFLFWQQGGSKAPQILNLKMDDKIPAKIVSVMSSSPNFSAELRPADKGKDYEVVVTPLDTSSHVVATITIQTDYPPGKPESYNAYAQVK